MILLQAALMILALALLYQLTVWAIPLLAGAGLAWLALDYGSGWLIAIGAGFAGAVLAFALLHAAMASRSWLIRLCAAVIFLAPPVWAGAVAARSLAVQAGAQGPAWPILAAIAGGVVFGGLAAGRLAGLAALRSAPPVSPSAPPPAAEPEPKVVYYQPIHPPTPQLRDGRGDDDRIIDV